MRMQHCLASIVDHAMPGWPVIAATPAPAAVSVLGMRQGRCNVGETIELPALKLKKQVGYGCRRLFVEG